MKKYIFLIVLLFSISFVKAQVKNTPTKTESKYRMLSKAKINGFNYLIYLKDINTDVAEASVKPKNTGEPEVVTATKKLIDYSANSTGNEYVLYRVNNKGKKELELIFPKTIKNEEKKIYAEGSYTINGTNLTINVKTYDYHFPFQMKTIYQVDKKGWLSFLKREPKSLNTDKVSDAYVKRATAYNIKSN